MIGCFLCGWRVNSELPLPELQAADAPHPVADLTIRIASVPEPLDNIAMRTPFVTISYDGSAIVEIKATGRYLIRGGSEILVEPAVPPDSPELSMFLWGTPLGILCYQRGLIPLHAATLLIHGCAVAIAGRSSAGKSTLAAELSLRGHTVLSDDITVVDTAPDRVPAALPSFPHLHLWSDTIEKLQIPSATTVRLRQGLEKFQVRLRVSAPVALPVPLSSVVLLTDGRTGPRHRLEPVEGFESLHVIASQIYRRQFADLIGLRASLFEGSSRIAAHAQVSRLHVRREFASLAAAADLVESVTNRAFAANVA